jgi:hypothetical protein
MEILRKVITPKLLVEITMFVRRYLKMKMTMIIKDSQTNKSSLIYITYVFLKFSKISTLKNL